MQVPIRKPGKYTHERRDPNLTEEKFSALKQELERLKTVQQPRAIVEVKRLAEMGDFSENAAYSIAKGRLRGINDRINILTEYLKHVVIITPNKNTGTVQLGSTVTVEIKNVSVGGFSQSPPTDPRSNLLGNPLLQSVSSLPLAHRNNQSPPQSPQKAAGDWAGAKTPAIKKTFTILGSSETDPSTGVISHQSPLGAALMGHRVGDTVEIQLAGKRVGCRIIDIA